MRGLFRVPRLLIPREGFEHWASPDLSLAGGKAAELVEKEAGEDPCAVYLSPRLTMGEKRLLALSRDHSYTYLEEDALEKLNRGGVFVERETPLGVRFGLVLCIDLEQFTFREGECSPVRPAAVVPAEEVDVHAWFRASQILECPHTVLYYREKKQRAVRRLRESDLELLYEFPLLLGGGKIRGSFVPAFTCEELYPDLLGKGEPLLVAVEGVGHLCAAKRAWEEKKAGLHREETVRNPARFALVELVNIFDETVEFPSVCFPFPEEKGEEVFAALSHVTKCKRDGKYFRILGTSCEAHARGLAALRAMLGALPAVRPPKEGELGAVFAPPDKEELFDALKKGMLYPAETVRFMDAKNARYALEAREIGYD